MKPIRVLIAASDPATRASCVRSLATDRRLRVVGHAPDAIDAIAIANRLRPRVVVVATDGALLPALLPMLRGERRQRRLIVVDPTATPARAVDALSLGAHGHVALGAVASSLPRAVRAVDAGQAWLPRNLVPALLSRLFGHPATPARHARQSPPRSLGPSSNRQSPRLG